MANRRQCKKDKHLIGQFPSTILQNGFKSNAVFHGKSFQFFNVGAKGLRKSMNENPPI